MTEHPAGARWWRFDFHAHTPASVDYGKGKDQRELKKRSPREWLLDFMRAKIDCVAITDHNSGEWIDSLKKAHTELKLSPGDVFHPLVLFPGVEISVNGGIHLLAILDPRRTTADITSLLNVVGFPRGEHGNTNSCTTESLQVVSRKIREFGGLAIPAHVDLRGGLFREMRGSTLRQFLDDGHVDAIELIDPDYEKPDTYKESRLNLASVVGTDSHHPAGAGSSTFPGSRFTWVKMGQPSFDGLRLALLDSQPLSIRRSDSPAGDPNQEPKLTIKRIEIRHGRHMGRIKSAVADFSPWLSTIIGGRGTGKSTLVEMVRLAMRRETDLPDSLRSDFQRLTSFPNDRPEHDATAAAPSAGICITLSKDDAKFRIRWSPEGTETGIEERTDKGWKPGLGQISSRFPVRILSQKEVFALATDSDALLRIIDEADEVVRCKWNEKRTEAETEFLSLRSQARAVASRLADRPRLEGELADLERQIAVFEEGGHRDLLHRYQRFRRQHQLLMERKEELATNVGAIRRALDEVQPSDFPTDDFADEPEGTTLIAEAVRRQNEVEVALSQQADDLEEFRENWFSDVTKSQWNENREVAVQAYDELVKRLTAEGIPDPGAYAVLLQGRSVLLQKLAALDALDQEKTRLANEARRVLDALASDRGELTKARRRFVAAVLGNNPHVKIEVVPFGSGASAAEGSFRDAIARQDGRLATEIRLEEKGSKRGVLVELFAGVPERGTARTTTIAERLHRLKSDFGECHLHGDGSPVPKRLRTHLQRLKPEQMDRFWLWWPADGLRVRYKRATTGEFVSLDQGSPGQKSAAILAFLLAHGDQPIILDQPEDDLDNHLIYDLVVEQIRENKRRRQVIVVTHNPNIVVNGDAEAVVAMDHEDGECVVATDSTGCLQDPGVRAEVCRVMEGGRKAFEDRYRRLKEGFSA